MDNVENCDSYTSDMLVIFVISSLRNARKIPYWISCFVYVVAEETRWCDVVNKISNTQMFCCSRYHTKNVFSYKLYTYLYMCDIEFSSMIPAL
jgi:hypothetical protein